MDFSGMDLTSKIKTLDELIEETIKLLQEQIAKYNSGETIQINNGTTHRYLQPISMQNIESVTKDFPIHLLKALYFCEDFTFLDIRKSPSLNDDNATSQFGYHSSFYLSFIANKDSLSDLYLNSRKSLCKSIMQIKEQKDLTQKQNNANPTNDLILQTNDKSTTIIFLDSNGMALKTNANFDSKLSMSNLIHIYNENNQNKIDIFTKHNTTVDLYELVKNYNEYGISLDLLHSTHTQIFLYATLLTGGAESALAHNECFFGKVASNEKLNFNVSNEKPNFNASNNSNNLHSTSNTSSTNDSNSDLDNSKPIYYLEYDEVDLNSSTAYETKKYNETALALLRCV